METMETEKENINFHLKTIKETQLFFFRLQLYHYAIDKTTGTVVGFSNKAYTKETKVNIINKKNRNNENTKTNRRWNNFTRIKLNTSSSFSKFKYRNSRHGDHLVIPK
jgi:hypothetical protein